MSIVTQSKAKKKKTLHTSRGTSRKSETRKSAERDSQRANAALAMLIYRAALSSSSSPSPSPSLSRRARDRFRPKPYKILER